MLCDHEVAEVDKERQRGIQSQRWQESCRPRISDAGGTPHRTRQERQRLISKARLESSLWSAYACSRATKSTVGSEIIMAGISRSAAMGAM